MNTKDQQTLFLAMAELAKVERAARVRQLAGVREWRRRKMAARVRLPAISPGAPKQPHKCPNQRPS